MRAQVAQGGLSTLENESIDCVTAQPALSMAASRRSKHHHCLVSPNTTTLSNMHLRASALQAVFISNYELSSESLKQCLNSRCSYSYLAKTCSHHQHLTHSARNHAAIARHASRSASRSSTVGTSPLPRPRPLPPMRPPRPRLCRPRKRNKVRTRANLGRQATAMSHQES